MSRLVRLYPQAWRDRYEDEFLSLLTERPPTLGDVLDTVRGAVDAHLNPQGDAEPLPWTHRVPGLLALIAGAMWTAVFLAFVLWQDAAWTVASLVPLSLLLMFLSLPGDYMAAHGRRIAMALGVLGLCIVIANLPYSQPGVVAGVGGWLFALGGMLTLAAIRAEIGFPVAFGLGNLSEDESWVLASLLPYGLAWLLIGLRMAIRGSATIIDLPMNPTEPEVRAA
jgi:hypothetical protein